MYTGPIDEFFDYRFGRLPYRSLDFQFETIDRPVFQDAPVINYPNENPYTRVTEFKYLTGQEHPKTTVVYEYPKDDGDPYYPVPRPENAALYRQYQALASARRTCISAAGSPRTVLQHGSGRRAGVDALQTHQRPAAHAADRAKRLSMGRRIVGRGCENFIRVMRQDTQCVPAHPMVYYFFVPEPGAAIPRCCSASMPAGVTLAIADCSLFFQPLTTSPSPRIMAS